MLLYPRYWSREDSILLVLCLASRRRLMSTHGYNKSAHSSNGQNRQPTFPEQTGETPGSNSGSMYALNCIKLSTGAIRPDSDDLIPHLPCTKCKRHLASNHAKPNRAYHSSIAHAKRQGKHMVTSPVRVLRST